MKYITIFIYFNVQTGKSGGGSGKGRGKPMQSPQQQQQQAQQSIQHQQVFIQQKQHTQQQQQLQQQYQQQVQSSQQQIQPKPIMSKNSKIISPDRFVQCDRCCFKKSLHFFRLINVTFRFQHNVQFSFTL